MIKIFSKLLKFRTVRLRDSDFIYELRNQRGRYLNNQGFTKINNKEWIKKYPEKEKNGDQFYFVISDKDQDIGIVRLYDINKVKKTFTWGSWILIKGVSPIYPIISTLMLYEFAFNYLKLDKALIDVRNKNQKVISFHLKTGAIFTEKDKLNHYFIFDKDTFNELKVKYHKYIGDISIQEINDDK